MLKKTIICFTPYSFDLLLGDLESCESILREKYFNRVIK